jgi:HJR/Mrr/RecB family endonuclease
MPTFKSFDITLDEHLSKKRSLATASLFPTEQIEINPIDLFEDLTRDIDVTDEKLQLTISDLDTLNPYLFEAAVAIIWEKMGYEVKLTPRTNDKGADVIAMSPGGNILLQVKQSKSPVSDSAIGEIMKAQGYYSSQFNRSFSLGVVTNNIFNSNTKDIAVVNKVELFDRSFLLEIMEKMELFLSEVNSLDSKR